MTVRLTRRLLLATPAVLAGCASPPPPPPPPVLELQLTGGANQNPDSSGQPAPLVLRLYDLVALDKFNKADVFALIERDKGTLGADSPGSEEISLSPGDSKTLTHKLKPDVQFVGLIALFRDVDHATWRVSQPVAAHGTTKLVAKTDGLTLTLTPA